jgi:hypothetical protein
MSYYVDIFFFKNIEVENKRLFQNFGSGADKITNMVDAINEYGPVGVGMVVFEWIQLIKSNQLVERLKNPRNIKVLNVTIVEMIRLINV